MRAVDHDAADADHAGAGILRERVDDLLGACQRLRVRREHLVDDRHLRGMDRHLADKAVAAGFLAFAAKAFLVAEIDIDRVDRRHSRGGGAGKTQRARQTIRIEEAIFSICLF